MANTCGFNDWLHIHNGPNECVTTIELLDKITSLVDHLVKRGKRVIILTSYYDAVKNVHANKDIPIEEVYDFLTDDFLALGYEAKANIVSRNGSKYDFRNWSAQQWPYNTIRFANDNNYHLIYIQSDWNYCQFPSVFSQAMCGVLYDTSEYIKDSAFHFSGRDHDLFCVGDSQMVTDMLKELCVFIASKYCLNTNNISIIPNLGGEIQWLKCSRSFNDSMHKLLIENDTGNDENFVLYNLGWLRYRWNISKSFVDKLLNEEYTDEKIVFRILRNRQWLALQPKTDRLNTARINYPTIIFNIENETYILPHEKISKFAAWKSYKEVQ